MDQPEKPEQKRGLALGIALGVAIGTGMGVAMGNITTGIGVGIAIGIALGLAIDNKKGKAVESLFLLSSRAKRGTCLSRKYQSSRSLTSHGMTELVVLH